MTDECHRMPVVPAQIATVYADLGNDIAAGFTVEISSGTELSADRRTLLLTLRVPEVIAFFTRTKRMAEKVSSLLDKGWEPLT